MTGLWWAGKCQDAQHEEPCHSPKLTANMVPTTYRRYAAASAAIRLINPELA